jgi:hypothetical protein
VVSFGHRIIISEYVCERSVGIFGVRCMVLDCGGRVSWFERYSSEVRYRFRLLESDRL